MGSLFCRVSSKEQEETGYSLPAQEKLLTDYAIKRDLRIAKVFSISESASGKKQRAVFKEMMKYLQDNHINSLVCEKVDRLTRNFKDANMIDEWLEADETRQVHLVKDSLILHKNSRSQEKLNWGIRILFAKNYIDNLSEEVRKGHKEKVAQGWLPTKPPVGYKTVGDKGHRIHVIDDTKAPLVQKMFELYGSGEYSLSRLTDYIYEQGLVNENGNKIVKSRIHTLLGDPFYIGKNRWNGVVTKGNQDTFISQELFNRVQEIMKKKGASKYQRHNYLLRNMVVCAECKGVITWEEHKGHNYGYCNHYKPCSQREGYREDDLEVELVDAMRTLQLQSARIIGWIRKALHESNQEEAKYHESALIELNTKLSSIKRKLNILYDDKLEEVITREQYEDKFKAISTEQQSIEEQIQKHNNADIKFKTLAMNIYEVSQHATQIYLKLDPINRKELLKLIFEKLEVRDGNLDYKFTYPFELIFKAVDQTNVKSSKVEEFIENLELKFEPVKMGMMTMKNGLLAGSCSTMLLG